MKSAVLSLLVLSFSLNWGCRSMGDQARLLGSTVQKQKDYGLGNVYAKPITKELTGIMPHLATYQGQILLGNQNIQFIFAGMSSSGQNLSERKVMGIYKRFEDVWQAMPITGMNFMIDGQNLTSMQEAIFSINQSSNEAELQAEFKVGNKTYDIIVNLGATSDFASFEFKSKQPKAKLSKMSLIVESPKFEVYGGSKGSRGDAANFFQESREVGIISLQPFSFSFTEKSARFDIVSPEQKFEFLVFVDSPEQQLATTSALKEMDTGRLKLQCDDCVLPSAVYVMTPSRQPLYKFTVAARKPRDYMLPAGTYVFTGDREGRKTWAKNPVVIQKDKEQLYKISNQGISKVVVKIEANNFPGSLSSLEIFEGDSKLDPAVVKVAEKESVVRGNKVFTEKNQVTLTLPKDKYTARLISQSQGKVCEFEITGGSDKMIEHDCKVENVRGLKPKWINQKQQFEKITYMDAKFLWPMAIYPVSSQTKEVWTSLYGSRNSVKSNEVRDFLSIRKSSGLTILTCPNFSRTLNEFETAIRSIKPDAVEIFGCNLRYDTALYLERMTKIMKDSKIQLVFITPDDTDLRKLPPQLAIHDSAVPSHPAPQNWGEIMRRGDFSIVWGSQLQTLNEDGKPQLNIRNLPGAHPRKIVFYTSDGKSTEVPIDENASMAASIMKIVPKFSQAKWWRAEVWGSWERQPNSSEPLTILGATNFQKNLNFAH